MSASTAMLWLLIVTAVSGLRTPIRRIPQAALHDCSGLFRDSLEEVQDKEITFSKPLPPWLNGNLVRNGPGCFGTVEGSETTRRYSHVFDGLSKLTSCSFNAKSNRFKVSFKRRYDFILFDPVFYEIFTISLVQHYRRKQKGHSRRCYSWTHRTCFHDLGMLKRHFCW